jgi:outer membrane protein assembly factor BamD (BamD/ComL family)
VGWLVGGALAAAVALAAIGLRPRPAEPTAAVAPAPGVVRLPDGVPLLAARDATVTGELGQATVTLYGRGWATHQGHRLTVEAEAFVVDQPAGDAAVEIAARGATIQVLRATFAVASSSELRVTVIRGEISLRCPGAASTSVVTAGQAARCEPPPAAPAPPLPAPATPGGLPGEPPPVPPAPRAASTAPRAADAATRTPAVRRETSASPPSTAGDVAGSPAAAASAAPAIATGSPEPDPPASAPRADPAARYAEAERLMASDADAARRALRALVTEAPAAPEAAPALLDLARLAAAGGDHLAALAALDELDRHPGAAALAMPAAYLRCLVTPGDAGRRACFAAFRARYPGSPHDADALAWLAAAAARAGDCAAAQALSGEFLERYPDAPTAPAIRAWKARCERAAPP